jgi:NADH:ubiquinone oxidoreductase subunit 6 (subunit J)
LLNLILIAFCILTVGSALWVLWTKNVLHAAFALLLTFLGVAALYVMAGADFLGITQILVYVGGILVLLIFGIMLTNQAGNKEGGKNMILTQNLNRFWGVLVAGGFFGVLFYTFTQAGFQSLEQEHFGEISNHSSTIQITGIQLMTDYVLPFEIVGVLLMIALVGASFLASKNE